MGRTDIETLRSLVHDYGDVETVHLISEYRSLVCSSDLEDLRVRVFAKADEERARLTVDPNEQWMHAP